MQDPSFRPPIPTPDGRSAPMPPPVYGPGDWQGAPPVVKGWAYPLTWLGIVLQPFILIGLFAAGSILGRTQIPLIFITCVLLAMQIYLNRTLKKRVPTAWNAQIALSIGVIVFQTWSIATNGSRSAASIVGILIHVYILSQWFKPDVKTWFQRA